MFVAVYLEISAMLLMPSISLVVEDRLLLTPPLLPKQLCSCCRLGGGSSGGGGGVGNRSGADVFSGREGVATLHQCSARLHPP